MDACDMFDGMPQPCRSPPPPTRAAALPSELRHQAGAPYDDLDEPARLGTASPPHCFDTPPRHTVALDLT